jgi:hypothetical protein
VHTAQIDLARLAAMEPWEADRLLRRVRESVLGGRRPPVRPRTEIAESWGRLLAGGLDPDRGRPVPVLTREETEVRRTATPLREVLHVLRDGLVPISDAARHMMLVTDAEGRVLWRDGTAPVLRKGDAHGVVTGSDWSEAAAGTNGVGTALVTGRPVQVHSAEHFVAALHSWTCAGAPVTDPRNGRLLGAVNLSGPVATVHPTTLPLVSAVARLAEAELRTRHRAALDRLRASAAPLLARMAGRALAVDHDGWPAAVIGMAPPERLRLPRSPAGGRSYLPSLGACAMEPLPGGWLIRVTGPEAAAPAARVVLEPRGPQGASVTVTGDEGSWALELSPRHAELLHLLALHPEGRSAAELAADLFGDPTRTVTVRAEVSRLRRRLAPVLVSRPYRFADGVEVEVRARPVP